MTQSPEELSQRPALAVALGAGASSGAILQQVEPADPPEAGGAGRLA
jgi:hypothetical protein